MVPWSQLSSANKSVNFFQRIIIAKYNNLPEAKLELCIQNQSLQLTLDLKTWRLRLSIIGQGKKDSFIDFFYSILSTSFFICIYVLLYYQNVTSSFKKLHIYINKPNIEAKLCGLKSFAISDSILKILPILNLSCWFGV